ncbi:MAG: hypothetical protein IPM53_17485 [Anaerolineaceae bacterium]|nr:hypothetical protein [Anaerolineaceae bacterium]
MHVVMSAFAEPDHAEAAVAALHDAGFTDDEIGVLMRGELKRASEADEALTGAGYGALAGTAVGGLFGLLVGAASISVPVVGPILASGLITSTLGGAAAGAVYGTLLGLVIKLGLLGEDAQFYTETLANNGVILVVQARGERAARAWRLMREAQATRTQSTLLGRSQNTAIAMPVIGLFATAKEAHQAGQKLLGEGINQEEIYLIDGMNIKNMDGGSGRFPVSFAPSPLNVGPVPPLSEPPTAETHLTRLGIDAADAPFYLDAVRQGGALLIVTTDDEAEAATSRRVMKTMEATQMSPPPDRTEKVA